VRAKKEAKILAMAMEQKEKAQVCWQHYRSHLDSPPSGS
jgi:hypothetical protein